MKELYKRNEKVVVKCILFSFLILIIALFKGAVTPLLKYKSFLLFFINSTIILIIQLIIFLIIKRFRIPIIFQVILYLLPLALLINISLIASRPENHRSPLISPNGKYVLTVSIDRKPNYDNLYVWKVHISDNEQNELYRDLDSSFDANKYAYWIWDEKNILWFYSEDGDRVYYWKLSGNKWIKKEWVEGADKYIPPSNLYPD